jgi:hypothetical protein
VTASGHVASTAQGEAANVAGTAKDEATNVASTAAGAAGDVAGTAKQEVGNVLGEGLEQAKNLTGQVKEQASQQLSTGSEKLTGSLRGLSQQLSNGDTSGIVGQVLSEAGTRVQSLADELERKGPQGVLNDLQDYARRNPGTFLIGMAAAGFLTGRLVKGVQAKEAPRALPAAPTGTAGGAPLAGIAEPSLGTSAGYVTSPYPEETYLPVDPAPLPTAPVSGPSGSAGPRTDYFDEPLDSSPLPADTETRDPR